MSTPNSHRSGDAAAGLPHGKSENHSPADANERLPRRRPSESRPPDSKTKLLVRSLSRRSEIPRKTLSALRRSESRSRSSNIFDLPLRRKSVAKQSKVDFRQLPHSAFLCILDQLRLLHNAKASPTCSTCFMRDLTAMQLSCSAWDADVKRMLYEHIDISGADSQDQLRKYKVQRGSRLKLLRRTLREQKLLTTIVKTIHVSDPNIPLYLPDGEPNPEFNDYRNLVASVVMLCPNLERLTGFYTVYNHEFDRLTHALSTRQKLKEHVWIIGENDEVTARCEKQLPPGLIDQHQKFQFLHYHSLWSNLEHLMLCSPGGAGIIEHGIFADILSLLPSLKHLCISSFDSDDFSDETLSFLPELVSLRLEECFGVTERGLARWSASPKAYSLRALSLIHQNIRDLTKISKILASLGLLKKFVIVQSETSPNIPSDEIIFQPVLASLSLEELHWDIAPEKVDLENPMSILQSQEILQERSLKTPDQPLPPNAHLALSILHAGFPRLKSLRAPQDTVPGGILQEVCRPFNNGSVLLPSDKLAPRPGPTVFQKDIPQSNSLYAARLRAQAQIDSHQNSPQGDMKRAITNASSASNDTADYTDRSNSIASSAETNITDLEELSSPSNHAGESFPGAGSVYYSKETSVRNSKPAEVLVELSCPWSETLLAYNNTYGQLPPQVPPRSPKRRAQVFPMRLCEVQQQSPTRSLNSTSLPSPAPHFKLHPDVPGRDGNGGIIGWGDLLRVGEKRNTVTSTVETCVKDACQGEWNRGASFGGRWRHVPREKWRESAVVEVKHFF